MDNDEIEDRIDQAYIRGRRAAWSEVLSLALKDLNEDKDLAQMSIYLDDIRAAVESLYEIATGETLQEDYHLGDAIRRIEKHWPEE